MAHLTQPAKNPKKSDNVCPLSLEPFPDKHAYNLHKTCESGKVVGDESSIVGRPKLSPSEAHKVTSPLKSFKVPPISLETTNTPLRLKRGKWKRGSRAQGKKSQNVDPQTQNVIGLSGSKRIGRLNFMDEDEGMPKKKLRDLVHTDVYDNQERSAVAAKQHCQKQ